MNHPNVLCSLFAACETLTKGMYIIEVTKGPLAGPPRQLLYGHRGLPTHGPLCDVPPLRKVWLSRTSCTPRRPRKRLRNSLLRNMRLSLRWLPSMAKHENLERVLHWRAKKYMWSIHKCDHNSLGNSKSTWALPMGILHSGSLPRSAPDSKDIRHACIQILAKLSHHCLQTSPHGVPPTRLLFIPPSSRHTPMSASHLRVRMNCTAAAHSNLTRAAASNYLWCFRHEGCGVGCYWQVRGGRCPQFFPTDPRCCPRGSQDGNKG